MTPKQLQRLLDEANLSQVEAARRLDVNPRTMRRWIAGDIAVPLVVELALRYVIDNMESRR